MIIEQNLNPNLTFVIDFESREHLDQHLRFYPPVEDLAHIIDVPPVANEQPEVI
jgi:hypothetical protein